MKAHPIRHARLLALWWMALPSLVQANGRMPGANDVVFDPRDPQHVLARATFGVVQSFDGGKTWQWICEQAVGTSGVISDPPIAILADGTFVLLPPTGGALLSRDQGCSWLEAPAPLVGQRGVDLTLDANDTAHLFVLTSTLEGTDGSGFGIYRSLLIETRDSGATWQVLTTLPNDFEAETVEVSPSDKARLYVSGTASKNPRLGIIQRSEDGGSSWKQSALDLPAGTGSLLISAIHPERPDWLWLRVPARGDTIGVLPARLYLSEDKGQSFRMLASTQHGMFGFALSPDGAEVAYGGPSDGLFVGPADGSAQFTKMNTVGVRCLRWTAPGTLYTCATEPANAFSLGVSHDRGASIEKLYALKETCPELCAAGTSSSICQEAWQVTRPFIGASGTMCEAPWAAAPDAGSVDRPDASLGDAGALDAGVLDAGGLDPGADASDTGDADLARDASVGPAEDGADCSCRLAGAPGRRRGRGLGALSASALAFLLHRRRRTRGRA